MGIEKARHQTVRALAAALTALVVVSAVPAAAQTIAQQQQAIEQVQANKGAIQALQSQAGLQVTAVDQQVTDAALAKAVRRVLVERTVTDPLSVTTGQAGAQHQVTMVAEHGEVSGRARFYVPMNDKSDWIVTFTAPLTGKNATFATETGLGNNASANVGMKLTFWSFVDKPQAAAQSSTQAQMNVLRQVGTALGTDSTSVTLELLRRAAIAAGGFTPAVQTMAAPLASPVTTGSPRLARILATPTLVNSPDRFWAAVAQDPTIIETTWSASFTPSIEFNRSTGDYLTDAFEEKTYDIDTQIITLAAGVSRVATVQKPGSTTETINTPRFYFGGVIRGGESISVPDEQNVCLPAAGDATVCVDRPVGAVTTADFLSATVELRYWEIGRSFGLNPRYIYARNKANVDGAAEKVTHTIEVPIYLLHKVSDITNRDFEFGSDLIGGVNVGYRKSGDRKGLFVAVFLSKAFGLP